MTTLILTAALAVSSQVTEVTVYNDRAQVIRTAEVELGAGLQTVRFEDLPAGIDSRGIQMDGTGAATVMDVRYKIENLKTVPQAAWQKLYDKEEELKNERKTVLDQRNAYAVSLELLLKISAKVTSTEGKEAEEGLNPEKWEKMLDMYLKQQLDYDADIRKANQELEELDKKLEKVREDIRAMGARRDRQRPVVEVDVDAAKAGPVVLQLSYLVNGPTWKPVYDVRVNTESRKIEIKTFALIRQHTGEEWRDVNLMLSTANPGLGGQHEVLQPWRLQVRGDRGAAVRQRGAYSVGFNSFSPMDNKADILSNDVPVVIPEAAAVIERDVEVARQGTAVVFTPEGVSTVDSDDVEHRIAVSSTILPAHFRYSAVPKLDGHAYLKAKAKNSSGHPFLAGSANIFLDDSSVATSQLKLVPPEEEFWVFLGMDAGMTVDYKLLKRYKSDAGRKNVRHTYEYLVKVKNTHDKPEEIIIWDQLPISESEKIKVKLLEPRYSKDTPSLKMDESKRLQWFKLLEPGEEWKIPYSFHVEAPKDMKISGLE